MNTTGFFETVEDRFKDWNYGHPKVIWGLIRAMKPSVVVEVGTYRGYAACYMARALQENNSGKLYCIDNLSLTDHAGRYGDPVRHWNDNLEACGVRGWAELVLGNSDDVKWPDRVDFAYIDGWHSADIALRDFQQCAARGAACICLDDTLNCVGPRMVVENLDPALWNVTTIPSDNGLSICTSRSSCCRGVTFSQELTNHPGVDLTALTPDLRRSHFHEASRITGLDYKRFNK